MTSYIVVIYPAPPATRDINSQIMSSSWGGKETGKPRVERCTARSPEAAVENSKVRPGEHAYVIDESQARRFDRAPQAPLVEVTPNGSPLPDAA